jgi:hypothetical protein
MLIDTHGMQGRMHTPWTHAISDDWDISEKLTHVVPADIAHQRHYQADWYRAKFSIADIWKAGAVRRPLSDELLWTIVDAIESDSEKKQMYDECPEGRKISWGYTDFTEITYKDSPPRPAPIEHGPRPH